MDNDLQYLVTDLIILSARAKHVVLLREGVEFVAVVLDRDEWDALLRGRRRFNARRLADAISAARGAVESGNA
jgi:hypothetical protein